MFIFYLLFVNGNLQHSLSSSYSVSYEWFSYCSLSLDTYIKDRCLALSGIGK